MSLDSQSSSSNLAPSDSLHPSISVHSIQLVHSQSERKTRPPSIVPVRRSPEPQHELLPLSSGTRRPVPISSGMDSVRGKRQSMEDKVTLLQHPMFSVNSKLAPDHAAPRSFFAVYDGHGGEVCAEYCRRYVHTNFVNQPNFLSNPADALRNAVLVTEKNFHDAAKKAHLQHTSGTCAVIVYIETDQIIVANVGGLLLFVLLAMATSSLQTYLVMMRSLCLLPCPVLSCPVLSYSSCLLRFVCFVFRFSCCAVSFGQGRCSLVRPQARPA